MRGGEIMDCMNYDSRWSEMEKRLNLQSIGEFIQNGSDTKVDKRGFSERLEKSYKDLRKYIEDTCGGDNADDIIENIVIYSNTLKDIYFSLGMKTGAKLIIQLTDNFESDF
jgi:hypothetical protein